MYLDWLVIRLLFNFWLLISFSEDEMDVSALNLGMIAAYYNISCEWFILNYIWIVIN